MPFNSVSDAFQLPPAVRFERGTLGPQDTPDAPKEAAEKLRKLGPLSQDERLVVATMALTVVLWIFGDKIGMSSVTAAMLGMSLQLFTGVITWADCLSEKGAWDTLVWFAVLIGMSSQLNAMGFISFLRRVLLYTGPHTTAFAW